MTPRRAVPWLALFVACGRGDPGPSGTDTVETGLHGSGAPTDTGGVVTAGTPAEITVGTEVTCGDPGARATQRFDTLDAPAEADKRVWFWGGGAVVADFDGDARLDVVLPGYWGTELYLAQPDYTYVRATALDGLDLGLASGGSAADYDGDGDLDLFVTKYLGRDKLLRNTGTGFEDVSDAAGISSAQYRSMSSAWADYDGDGDLDLFVGRYGYLDESGVDHSDFLPADPSALYRNEGDGTFADLSSTLPPEVHDGYTFVGSWIDLDDDARPELYLVNDFGVAYPNRLLWNRGGGVLELDLGAHGLDVEITGMGLGLGDLNGDGTADMVMPAWNGIHVFESSELGAWVSTGFARGIYNDIQRGQKVGWGAEMADMDNDGDLDVPLAFGFLDSILYNPPPDEPDALFEQDDHGDFTDAGTAWGFDHTGDARGFVVVDLDGNGFLDVVKRDLSGPTVLNMARCDANGWATIRLRAPGPNAFGVGARVRVWAGGPPQTRWVFAGGTNHASAGPPEVHFGLADAARIERIEVRWPDGAISNLFDQPVRTPLTITRL